MLAGSGVVMVANSLSLAMQAHHGSLLLDRLSGVRDIRLSACNADGTVEWELGGSFYELAQLQLAETGSPLMP